MKMPKFKSLLLTCVAAGMPVSIVLAQTATTEQTRDQIRDQTRTQSRDMSQDRIYGAPMMSRQEMNQYRARMDQAKSEEERLRLQEEHRERMRERARERHMVLSDDGQTVTGGQGGQGGGSSGSGAGGRGSGGRGGR